MDYFNGLNKLLLNFQISGRHSLNGLVSIDKKADLEDVPWFLLKCFVQNTQICLKKTKCEHCRQCFFLDKRSTFQVSMFS